MQMVATETLARETAKVQRRKSIALKAVEEFRMAQLEGGDARNAQRAFNPVVRAPAAN